MTFQLIPPEAWALPVHAVRQGLASEEHWQFTSDYVSFGSKGLGAEAWTEPMAAYRGVLRSFTVAGGERQCEITLLHRTNEQRNVQLYVCPFYEYETRIATSWWYQQKRHARLFGLPALVLGDEGFVVRRPEDLGKSVRRLVWEGVLPLQFDPTAPPPRGNLLIRSDPPALTITTKPALAAWLAVPLGVSLVMLGAGAVAAALLQLHAAPTIVQMGLLVMGSIISIVGVMIGVGAFLSGQLSVSPDEVRWGWGLAGKLRPHKGVKAVRADRIEEVAVTNLGVHVIADGRILELSFAKQHRRWVRDCIIAVISVPEGGGE